MHARRYFVKTLDSSDQRAARTARRSCGSCTGCSAGPELTSAPITRPRGDPSIAGFLFQRSGLTARHVRDFRPIVAMRAGRYRPRVERAVLRALEHGYI